MIRKVQPPAPGTLEKVQAVAARTLSGEELRDRLAVPVTAEERAEVLSLVGWFRRRYPTPAERLAYVRRAYRRWRAVASRQSQP